MCVIVCISSFVSFTPYSGNLNKATILIPSFQHEANLIPQRKYQI